MVLTTWLERMQFSEMSLMLFGSYGFLDIGVHYGFVGGVNCGTFREGGPWGDKVGACCAFGVICTVGFSAEGACSFGVRTFLAFDCWAESAAVVVGALVISTDPASCS
jgi:hypothetical protein